MLEPGNQFWKMRSRHGRLPDFPVGPEGALKLMEACEDYFEWAAKSPLYEDKVMAYEGQAWHEKVAHIQAFTIIGLCLYIDVASATWKQWRSTRQDLAAVIAWAEDTIRNQKFNAAAAGLLNANIISRDLGLADRTEVSGPGGGPVQMVSAEMTPEEAADLYAQTREAGKR